MKDSHVRKINRNLVYGWMLIVLILFVSYTLEVVKGQRSLGYLVIFMLVTAVPAIIVLILYLKKPDRYSLRYTIVGGYFIMYIFVMITGSTTMVFSYILPMLSLLVLYHKPVIILVTGICATLLNIISILLRFNRGEITTANSKDIEIQLALLFLCFLGSYLATRIYDEIHKTNEKYNKELTERNRDIERMTMQTITTIANTIDAKDEYTRGHSRRVAEYSAAIAAELGMSEVEVSNIRIIGLLHDIGKISIPDSVLNKPGKLTNEEYQVMKGHTIAGAEILKDIDMISGLEIGAKYHHERIDGKGYPEGLSGDDIPYIARIIAVADSYDAMSSNRVYRKHLPTEKILSELRKGCGTQWDTEITNIMIKLIQEDRLPKVNPDAETELVQQTSTILSRVIDIAEDRGGENKDELDELTSTYGRDKGKAAIQNSIAKYGTGCLLIFDLDHFHKINDIEGFIVGDIYLKKTVEQIRNLSENQIISRFGADEFVVYFPELNDLEDAEKLAEIFLERVKNLVETDSRVSRLSVSIGITEVVTEKDKIMFLYENANKALYVAKQQGGNTYYCHQPVDYYNEELSDPAADLKKLVEIIQNHEHYKGGLIAAYPEFGKMYEFISSLAVRNDMQVQIALFTVSQIKGTKTFLDEQERVMELLEKAMVNSVRNVDVVTRYSSTQLAILLMNLSKEEVDTVINRIMTEFLRTYDKNEFSVHYDTADLSK
ncbi:MAG: diguanylate cyclase [Lachnospiraceae bacterium]|nr:diguanylate cyclase [Lachnospiraceae bacterium]MBR1817183.1 diguanylate cyclase [Lachnospiraceae bacterium]